VGGYLVNYDVAIIGAGVVGSLIARELSKYELSVVLLEKCNDMAMGTTKANSAIVHAGFDSIPGTLKAKFNVEGVKLMPSLCKDLSVPYKNIGSFVIAFNDAQMTHLTKLLMRGNKNGVPGLRIVGQDKLREMEPNINIKAVGALWAPSASIICPYELNIAAVENAVTNGVTFMRNFEVIGSNTEKDGTISLRSANNCVQAKYVINSAGVFSDEIAAMFGDNDYKIIPRKGEYFLFDKTASGLVSHVVFQCPTKMGKGVLIAPTVHGNVIVGPNAIDIEDKDNCATTIQGGIEIMEKARRSIITLSTREMITAFGGLRAHLECDDFIIEQSQSKQNIINIVGIESPGLSAAPAIAIHVAEMFMSMAGEQKEKIDFNPVRPAPIRFRELDDNERREIIKKNKAYGRVICRCETITEGEILDAIHAPAGARDIDGVKRRTRAGMGRCQGGFCGSKVLEILSRELDIPPNEVTKFGGKSKILFKKTK
jgi:glycerol-3-phosphate dehydrogenase